MQIAFKEDSENLLLRPTDETGKIKEDKKLIAAIVAAFSDGGKITVEPNDGQPPYVYHMGNKGIHSTGPVPEL